MENRNKGFTLIELLVVIAIIAILSTVVMAGLNSARLKGRDAKRISDIKAVQTALELCFDNLGGYPAGSGVNFNTAAGRAAFIGASCGAPITMATYLASAPTPPTPPATNNYVYTAVGAAPSASYTLTFTLEGNTGSLTGPATHTATPAGIQ